jgi:dienelactone hydrolase
VQRSIMVWVCYVCAALVVGVQTSEIARSADRVNFTSATFANIGQAALGVSTEKVVVDADLGFPANKMERYPAIVIAHASGGYSETNEGWFAAELRKAGFATLTYDSFVPRKWGSKVTGGDPRVVPAALADAFAALRLLADHPKIDPQRIAIIGFSLGGEVAHMAAFERFRKVLAPEQRFAAHVGFYPSFNMGTRAGPQAYTGAPLLLLLAEKDELATKAQGYLAYLDKANTEGPQTVTYSGAYHAWSNPNYPMPRLFPDFSSGHKCPMLLVGEAKSRLLVDGEEKNFDLALWENCLNESRGRTMGFSAKMRAKSLADTIAFLRKSLRM